MRNLKTIIATVLFSVLFSIQAGAQEYFMHTVTQGQGLYSISRMYGVTEDEIIRLNPGSEKVIRTGEQLRIPNKKQTASGKFHTIQKGETLFRLSVQNRISVKELCDANPGLSVDNFKVGQVITIPAPSDKDPLASTIENAGENAPQEIQTDAQTIKSDTAVYKTTHVVKKRETIFRICRNYDITQEEFLEANPEYKYTKLKQGAVVKIPFSSREIAQRKQRILEARNRMESIPDSMLFSMNELQEEKSDGTLTAALILPFSLEDSTTTLQKQMVEFYQGILLALDRLKEENISVNLKVFDSQGEGNSLEPLLESGKLDDVNIIFGPRWTNQITEVARWSTVHQVPLVLPMNAGADDVFNNPYVYQLNTPQSYFNQEIYNHFLEQFDNANVILLDADEYRRNEFIDGLKHTLSDHGIPLTTLMVDTTYQILMDTLVPGKQNIFIINSDESGPLNTMLPVLQIINRTKAPEIETHLFGYPKYQIYAADHLEEFYEVDTWFYTWFYTNNMLKESVEFNTLFRRSFSRQMMISYPSFAPYGYDTGYFFLKGLATYGKDFENHLNDLETDPVHVGFKFERVNNWGGFINRKVFFIHFSNDYKVEKKDFDR
ncbi:MAG: LysM peptidoglycan-binding domain-containing protein [Bacteroidaceae bacterium]|nr:LysM peptidoglycan-binding domain-containing protein [Bacteroidaceae bacterium]MBR5158742.1 LysM peptidoglycan-binding domain-containing protein [Bacteroidaceae bacterium]